MEINTIEDLINYLKKTKTDLYIIISDEIINGLKLENKFVVCLLEEIYEEDEWREIDKDYLKILKDGNIALDIKFTPYY